MAIRETTHAFTPHVERPMADSPRPYPARRPRRVSEDYGLMGVALLAGPANVIMELSRPGVGHGVAESRVESGRIDRHPIKRARTTFTYIAVANAGTDEQKAAYRRAVNRSHAQVYSRPGDPVKYNAFDPELQLWVAACIYKGGIDIYRTFVGEMPDEDADRLYREAMTLGTTLQVPAEMHIDDTVREFLYPIAVSRVRGVRLPRPLRERMESFNLLITTGFLPQRFRDEMRLPWDATMQRRFDRLMAVVGAVNRKLPRFIRQFPFNLMLWDLDRRIKKGRPLV
jgi:uncharacterized protein (DUF2236 family)